MSKKTKTKTIGAWAESIGANVRNNAHWTLMHTGEGTFAVVLMRTLIMRNGTVIAVAEPGSPAVGVQQRPPLGGTGTAQACRSVVE